MVAQQYQTSQAHEIIAKRYFEAFNHNDFKAIAALFALEGELHPPFEQAIVGRAAIADYLEREAREMKAYPQSFDDLSESGELQVMGQVDAIAFKVGVEWTFSLTEAAEIQSLSVRLRASMKELLDIRST